MTSKPTVVTFPMIQDVIRAIRRRSQQPQDGADAAQSSFDIGDRSAELLDGARSNVDDMLTIVNSTERMSKFVERFARINSFDNDGAIKKWKSCACMPRWMDNAMGIYFALEATGEFSSSIIVLAISVTLALA